MSTRKYRGTVLDSGHCHIFPERFFSASPFGVSIRVEGSGHMSSGECRRLAGFLLEAAEWCDRRNDLTDRLMKASAQEAAALVERTGREVEGGESEYRVAAASR